MLEIKNLTKTFNSSEDRHHAKAVLKGMDLQVHAGEFLTILGPSGCGKSTLLRILAGLEIPDKGAVLWKGLDVTTLPPQRRPFRMVFQDYALFPHLTVEENLEFPLKIKKTPKNEILNKIEAQLNLIQLIEYRRHFPHELSGGQKQRVALARALIGSPEVLLLDEPFAAIDPSLRQSLRSQLRELQKVTQKTFILVTHDRSEALELSDRIVVMKQGQVKEVSQPLDLLFKPKTISGGRSVGFLNLVDGTVIHKNDQFIELEYFTANQSINNQRIRVSTLDNKKQLEVEVGDPVQIGFRPFCCHKIQSLRETNQNQLKDYQHLYLKVKLHRRFISEKSISFEFEALNPSPSSRFFRIEPGFSFELSDQLYLGDEFVLSIHRDQLILFIKEEDSEIQCTKNMDFSSHELNRNKNAEY